MSRTIESVKKSRNVEKWDLVSGQSYYVKEYYSEVVVRLKNKCNKNIRVLGLSKGYINRKLVYGVVWKDVQANFSTSFSRESDDLAGSLIGGIFSSMIFGGGEMSDIDLSSIGKKFNNNINAGEYQYLRIIELNSISNATASKSGGKIVEVTSYSGSTKTSVKKGDKIYVKATGSVKTGAFSGYAGPAGQQYTPMWNIVPAYNYGALMVKVGNSKWMLVGEEAEIIAPAAGAVSFVVNDTDPSDNYGSFTVEYNINKPLQKNTPPKLNDSRQNSASTNKKAGQSSQDVKESSAGQDVNITQVKVEAIWTLENTSLEYGCNMRLKIDSKNKVRGAIKWTLNEIDEENYDAYKGKLDATAIETIEGTYNPLTKKIAFQGISKDDPDGIITLTTATIRLKEDNVLTGRTEEARSGQGRIRVLTSSSNFYAS